MQLVTCTALGKVWKIQESMEDQNVVCCFKKMNYKTKMYVCYYSILLKIKQIKRLFL